MYKPRKLADAVDKVARQSAGKDWGLYADLLDHWVEIAGTEYAPLTTPVKISFPFQPNEAQRKNGTLTIRLPKGLAMEFSFKADVIRHRVNAYLGYEAFARVALDPANILPPPQKVKKKADLEAVSALKEKASVIGDPELREALESFGEAMISRDAEED